MRIETPAVASHDCHGSRVACEADLLCITKNPISPKPVEAHLRRTLGAFVCED
jgi:hypothetical protein